MESDEIKMQYFRQQLEAGIRRVFEAQRVIAVSRIYSRSALRGRSGTLLNALSSPQFSLQGEGKGLKAVSNIPMYLRFLDLKRKGNYKIYNRQVWGILYGETLKDIKYGFRDWLKEHFPQLLQRIGGA